MNNYKHFYLVAEVQRIAQNPTIATSVHTRLLLPPMLTGATVSNSVCDLCSTLHGVNFVCHSVGNATAGIFWMVDRK